MQTGLRLSKTIVAVSVVAVGIVDPRLAALAFGVTWLRCLLVS